MFSSDIGLDCTKTTTHIFLLMTRKFVKALHEGYYWLHFMGEEQKTVRIFLYSWGYIFNVSRRHSTANLMNGFIFSTSSYSSLSQMLQPSTKLYVKESNKDRDVILKCDKTPESLFLYFVTDMVIFIHVKSCFTSFTWRHMSCKHGIILFWQKNASKIWQMHFKFNSRA